MKPEIKEKWIKRLRETPLSQRGDGALRCADRMCPLGILADIIDPDGWERDDASDEFTHRGLVDVPCLIVLATAGVPTPVATQIFEMNDENCFSFEETADWIEENL